MPLAIAATRSPTSPVSPKSSRFAAWGSPSARSAAVSTAAKPSAATLTRQLRDLDLHITQTTALRDRLATVVAQLQSGRDLDSYDLMTLIGDTMVMAEGKTKIVEEAGNGEVLVRSKDDITAGDGAKHDVLDGKAAASTRTTCNIFQLLERNGVRTHFVDRVDDVTFRARNVEMIPLELVARRYATGSFRDRFPDLPDGAVFEELTFESSRRTMPITTRCWTSTSKQAFCGGTCPTRRRQKRSARTPRPAISSLKSRWERAVTPTSRLSSSQAFGASPSRRSNSSRRHGGSTAASTSTSRSECGFDRETGDLLVADVIDSDSGRLRFGDVDMSKQSYRDGTATLPEIKKKFDEVAALTDRFV